MKCPHCAIAFHEAMSSHTIGTDVDGGWVVQSTKCPACNRLTLRLVGGPAIVNQYGQMAGLRTTTTSYLIRPFGMGRQPAPPEVPQDLTDDYHEACTVLPFSPKSSAALGRRCLQHLLRTHAKVKPDDLYKEIQQVINSGALPAQLCDAIDAIRHIGNMAAHPMKSQHTGEIIDVEPGEAEWTLDVLEALFDFYFVQPAILQKKKDALNQKLTEAGKKPMT